MKIKEGMKTVVRKFDKPRTLLKPKKCIKGILMVVFGILNTRSGIGAGRITANLTLGILTYLFLVISGMIAIEIFLARRKSDSELPITMKKAKQLYGATNAIAVIIAISHVMIYNINVFIIIITIIISALWFLLASWGSRTEENELIKYTVISLSFSIGMIYGAALNMLLIPLYIYCFFLTAFFLQFSREIAKGLKSIEGDKNEKPNSKPAISLDTQKILTLSLCLQILAMIFLILPIFTEILNSTMFFYAMIIGLIVIGYSSYVTYKSKTEENYKKMSSSLKYAIFFTLVAFLFASI